MTSDVEQIVMYCTDGKSCDIGCAGKRECEGKDPEKTRKIGRIKKAMDVAKNTTGWDSIPAGLHGAIDYLFKEIESA
jgi:hypothetical protein